VAYREAAINWLISSFLSETLDFYVIRPRILPELSKRANKSLLPILLHFLPSSKENPAYMICYQPDVHEGAFRWAASSFSHPSALRAEKGANPRVQIGVNIEEVSCPVDLKQLSDGSEALPGGESRDCLASILGTRHRPDAVELHFNLSFEAFAKSVRCRQFRLAAGSSSSSPSLQRWEPCQGAVWLLGSRIRD
jgi:hypothetical protein